MAPVLLPLLGNYMSARTLLIWLAIPSFIGAFYATSDRLLVIAGQANVALMVTASSFAVLTTSPFGRLMTWPCVTGKGAPLIGVTVNSPVPHAG